MFALSSSSAPKARAAAVGSGASPEPKRRRVERGENGRRRDPVSDRADELHEHMRQIYQDRYDVEMSPAFLLQLSLILFKKRRQPTPSEEAETGAEDDAAYASMEETWLAIRDVLADRYEYLQYEGIDDIHHLMDQRQRAEMVTYVRDKFASSLEQRKLQERDKGTAKGWEATGKGKGRGDSHPAGKVGAKGKTVKGKGEGEKGQTLNEFVRHRIRSRWHRHLQIKYGSKEIWEVLAFTGSVR